MKKLTISFALVSLILNAGYSKMSNTLPCSNPVYSAKENPDFENLNKIDFKSQDNSNRQHLSPEETVRFTTDKCSFVDQTTEPTCNDGIQNGNETSIDCGGPCMACREDTVICGDFGMSYIDNETARVYHVDQNWSNPTNIYACVDGKCYQAKKKDGYYYYDFSSAITYGYVTMQLNKTYKVEFKLNHNGGYYSTGVQNLTFTTEPCSFTNSEAPTCNDGIQNGDETGIDCGGSCTACGGSTGICDDFGMSYIDDETARVYHVDQNWGDPKNIYACIDGRCYPAKKQDGYYYYDFSSAITFGYVTMQLNRTYKVEFKLNHKGGYYTTGEQNLTFTTESCSFTNMKHTLSENLVSLNNARVYPNPVKDILYVETNSDISNYEIYTIHGVKVLEGAESSIDVSNLKQGIYMIKVNKSISKFMKQ